MSQRLWRKALRQKGISWEIASCGNLETFLPKHKSNDTLVKESYREMDGSRLSRWKEHLTWRQKPSSNLPWPFPLNFTLSKFWVYFSSHLHSRLSNDSKCICPPAFQGNYESLMKTKVFLKTLFFTDRARMITCLCKDTPSFHNYLHSLLIRSTSKFNNWRNDLGWGYFVTIEFWKPNNTNSSSLSHE